MNNNVLVVGGGPTGLVITAELKKYGISVETIEERQTPNKFSKALSVSASSLKIFHGMNIIDKFMRQGHKMHDVFVYYKKKRITHINKRFLKGIYNYLLSIPQPETEEILLDHIASMGAVYETGCELRDLKQHDTHVEAVIFSKKENKEIRKNYSYVIGCDGSKSTVRELLGLPFTGKDYDMHFIMADVFLNTSFSSAKYLIDETGFIIVLPMRDNMTRIVIKKTGPLPKDHATPSIDEIQSYLNKYLTDAPIIQKMVWSSSAPFYSRLTPTNFINRVFLAGDAYHLFSPIGGQGMNTGLQDAVNLAWKLAFVMQGKASHDLLQSYHLERFKAVQKTLCKTDIYTKLMCGEFDAINNHPFLPTMSNRKNFKNALPNEFAGFLNDYSEDAECSSLVGRHVPYFKIHNGPGNIASSYDLPSLKKLIIILDESKMSQVFLDSIKTYSSIAMVMDISQIEQNDFKAETLLNNICVIRPDGYIGYLVSINNSEGLFNYLKNSIFVKKEAM